MEGEAIYSSPLPQVLILTAIVVSISTTALGLALVVRIREEYGTIEEDDIDRIEYVEEVQKEHLTQAARSIAHLVPGVEVRTVFSSIEDLRAKEQRQREELDRYILSLDLP